jgi:hypothetical protein
MYDRVPVLWDSSMGEVKLLIVLSFAVIVIVQQLSEIVSPGPSMGTDTRSYHFSFSIEDSIAARGSTAHIRQISDKEVSDTITFLSHGRERTAAKLSERRQTASSTVRRR